MLPRSYAFERVFETLNRDMFLAKQPLSRERICIMYFLYNACFANECVLCDSCTFETNEGKLLFCMFQRNRNVVGG